MESVHISAAIEPVCLPECLRDTGLGCHTPIVCCDMCPPDCEEASPSTICPQASSHSACTYQSSSTLTEHHSSSHNHVCNSPRVYGRCAPDTWDLDEDDEALFLDEDPMTLGERFSKHFCCSRDWCCRESQREPCREPYHKLLHPSSCAKENSCYGEETCVDEGDCETAHSTPQPLADQGKALCCSPSMQLVADDEATAVEDHEQTACLHQEEEKSNKDKEQPIPQQESLDMPDMKGISQDSELRRPKGIDSGDINSVGIGITNTTQAYTLVQDRCRTLNDSQVKPVEFSDNQFTEPTHIAGRRHPLRLGGSKTMQHSESREKAYLDQACHSDGTAFGILRPAPCMQTDLAPPAVRKFTPLRTPEASPSRLTTPSLQQVPGYGGPHSHNWMGNPVSQPWTTSVVPTIMEEQVSNYGDIRYNPFKVPPTQAVINHSGLSPLTDQLAVHTSATSHPYAPLTPVTTASISPETSPQAGYMSNLKSIDTCLYQQNRKRECSPADDSPCPRSKLPYTPYPRLGSTEIPTSQANDRHNAKQMEAPPSVNNLEVCDKDKTKAAPAKSKGWPCRYPWQHPGDSLVTFADASNRRKHEQSHWQMAPYGCYHQPKCKTRIARSDDAKRHLVEGGCRIHRALHPNAPKGKNGKPELPLPPDFDDRRRRDFKKAREKEDEYYRRRKKEWLDSDGKMP